MSYKEITFIALLCFSTLVMGIRAALASFNTYLPIVPVPGTLDVFAGTLPPTLEVFDTRTGELLFEQSFRGADAVRNNTLDKVALVNGSNKISWLNLTDGSLYEKTFDLGTQDEVFFKPVEWSLNSTNIIYSVYDSNARVEHIYHFDLQSESLTLLKSFAVAQPIDPVDFPQLAPDFTLDLVDIRRNPVYDTWLLFQATAYRPLNSAEETLEVEVVHLLWNYETDQYLHLSDMLSSIEDKDDRYGWSPDGKFINYPGGIGTRNETVVYLVEFDPDTLTVAVRKTAPLGERRWISFLGINDLMITGIPSYQANVPEDNSLYTISQYIDGAWYDTPFFEIGGNIRSFDFNLSANEAERYELSCLFDLALPTRLADSDSAITLSSLPVLEAPQPDAAIFTTLDPQTAITLTGERACTDHVRWQKVSLSDGQSGWVIEADQNHHYLEMK